VEGKTGFHLKTTDDQRELSSVWGRGTSTSSVVSNETTATISLSTSLLVACDRRECGVDQSHVFDEQDVLLGQRVIHPPMPGSMPTARHAGCSTARSCIVLEVG
jgi:hypothetical protein